jgi:hypothetical protein
LEDIVTHHLFIIIPVCSARSGRCGSPSSLSQERGGGRGAAAEEEEEEEEEEKGEGKETEARKERARGNSVMESFELGDLV